MNPDPDAKLILACQEAPMTGLDGPFRELYELYKDRVYNVCYRITGNPSDALDAAQETFGILFRKIREFRFESKFSSWVYRIAVNASIDLKRRSRARSLTSLDALQEGRGPLASAQGRFDPTDEKVEMPIHAASRHELEREVQRAISNLSPKLRAITVLRYIESQSYEQIAETLQISLGTVKSRLARAHDMLDRFLTPVLDRYYLG
ncbi:MAG: sigma-70 family RNA polymerase sigma factor [Phycisphaerae bacterium]|jgi:RNA polymerase sigma-70 factor (ECF subfamily)|nr:sigma-70 family RNA polymerase sigma factor [Planctomycetota bacterium]NUQ50798.1 sigma-70 family RNA polymerase sigma factor [Phycisphaerae bacterium]